VRRYLFIAALVAASLALALALALAEIMLRIVGPPHEIAVGWGVSEKDLESVRETYRAQLAAGPGRRHLRVLLLGDSQVTNTGTSPKVLPAKILEEELRKALAGCGPTHHDADPDVQVFTVGQSGWGQDQELLALSALIATVRPHLVLHWFTPETRLRQLAGAGIDFTSHFPLPYDPDGRWDRTYLPPTRMARAFGADDKSADLIRINPYFEWDPIDLEKSHLVIAMNPESPRIDYMVRLTASLIREIHMTARRSNAAYAAFYYSAEKTNLPMYPPDGTYRARGYEFVVSHAGMRERLAEIFDGVRAYEIALADNDWRLPHNDPHLNSLANRHVLQSLSRQLVESGVACTLPAD
jgi:hypothetical protein